MSDIYDILQKKYPEITLEEAPYLDEYFKNNNNVAGMAIGAELNGIPGERRVIYNPYSNLQESQKQALLLNERLRHLMDEENFKLNRVRLKQKNAYKETPYEGDTLNIGRTEAARYLSGDKHHLSRRQKKHVNNFINKIDYKEGGPTSNDENTDDNDILPWDFVSMKNKAYYIKNAVKYGFSKDLNEIKDMYNYIATMEKVDKNNHKNWEGTKKTIEYGDGGLLKYLKSGVKKLFNMETFEDNGKFEDLNSKDKKILLDYSKNLNLSEEELEEMYNRGELRPFIQGKINSNFKYEVRENDSPTSKTSSEIERYANSSIYNTKGGVSPNMKYAIPYIEDKEIKVPGVGRISTNALDSIAKYAQIANIPIQDALGLAAQETNFGASLWANMKQPKKEMTEEQKQEIREYNRAIGNMSYFRNAGIIPAEHLVRDFRYNIVEDPISRNIPPLLHAFEYFKSGKYNRGDKNHTKDVKNKGKKVFETPAIQEWWSNSEFNPNNKNGSNNRKP